MTNTTLENFIKELPIDEAERTKLLSDLSSGVPAQTILNAIETILNQRESALDKEFPEDAAAHKAIDEEYRDAVLKAKKEFDDEMVKIEAEAAEINRQMMKKLDDVRLEETKADILSHPQ